MILAMELRHFDSFKLSLQEDFLQKILSIEDDLPTVIDALRSILDLIKKFPKETVWLIVYHDKILIKLLQSNPDISKRSNKP